MRKPGTKWGSLALPQDLIERIQAEAAKQGRSASFLGRQILEGHFPPPR